MTELTDEPIEIGRFRTSSGRVLIADGGYADLWRTGRPDDENLDLKITGPDAEEAGRALDVSSHPLFLWDLPAEHLEGIEDALAEACAAESLDARIEVLPERVPHAERLEHHFATGDLTHGSEIQGIWVGVTDSLPQNVDLSVWGLPFADSSEFAGRWKDVWVQVDDAPVVRSEPRGYTMVDSGCMLFIDPSALDAWTEDGEPGHSMSYMSAIGATARDPHESTTIPMDGTTATFFSNRWGDGVFEIFADFDKDDRLVRFRAAVGSEKTQARLQAVLERADKTELLALVSRMVSAEQPPRYVYLEPADNERDSGWRVLEGSESDEFLNTPENVGVASLADLVERFPSLAEVFETEEECSWERDFPEDDWVRVDGWDF